MLVACLILCARPPGLIKSRTSRNGGFSGGSGRRSASTLRCCGKTRLAQRQLCACELFRYHHLICKTQLPRKLWEVQICGRNGCDQGSTSHRGLISQRILENDAREENHKGPLSQNLASGQNISSRACRSTLPSSARTENRQVESAEPPSISGMLNIHVGGQILITSRSRARKSIWRCDFWLLGRQGPQGPARPVGVHQPETRLPEMRLGNKIPINREGHGPESILAMRFSSTAGPDLGNRAGARASSSAAYPATYFEKIEQYFCTCNSKYH